MITAVIVTEPHRSRLHSGAKSVELRARVVGRRGELLAVLPPGVGTTPVEIDAVFRIQRVGPPQAVRSFADWHAAGFASFEEYYDWARHYKRGVIVAHHLQRLPLRSPIAVTANTHTSAVFTLTAESSAAILAQI